MEFALPRPSGTVKNNPSSKGGGRDGTVKQTDRLSGRVTVPSPRSEDRTSTGPEQEAEEAISQLASRFGEHPNKVSRLVDQFGAAVCVRALDKVQEAQARGKRLDSPFGYMVSLLRSGSIQAELARETAEAQAAGIHPSWLQQRYERAQADPRQDTAAKRLARVKLNPELAALEAEKCR